MQSQEGGAGVQGSSQRGTLGTGVLACRSLGLIPDQDPDSLVAAPRSKKPSNGVGRAEGPQEGLHVAGRPGNKMPTRRAGSHSPRSRL